MAKEDTGPDIIAMTQRRERVRGALYGTIRTVHRGIVLVLAIRVFEAGQIEKGLLAGSFTFGLLLTPFILHFTNRLALPVSRAAFYLFSASAVSFIFAALLPGFPAYFLGMLFGLGFAAATAPLITALWRQNIPTRLRGQLFSRVAFLGIVSGFGASLFAAWWIERSLNLYRPLIMFLALASAIAAISIRKIPTEPPLRRTDHPLSNLSYLWCDKTFGYVSIAWMLMGFANLATLPLRTEYVALSQYGMEYSSGMIVLLVTIVPELIRMPAVLLWGRIFDTMNFIAVRMVMNLFFASSIVLFFIPSLIFQIAGSVLFGLATGGGEVAWNLWVTKFAPSNRTAEYMSVHTFLTGCRGLVGPILAMNLVVHIPIQYIAWSAAGLILCATVMLGTLLKRNIDQSGCTA
jgi:MFS family permease